MNSKFCSTVGRHKVLKIAPFCKGGITLENEEEKVTFTVIQVVNSLVLLRFKKTIF